MPPLLLFVKPVSLRAVSVWSQDSLIMLHVYTKAAFKREYPTAGRAHCL